MSTIHDRILRGELDGLVSVIEESGCWEWQRRRNRKNYGLVDLEGHTTSQAHRVVFEAATGIKVPEGLHVMHMCENPPCVNPAHMALGTHQANQQDRWLRNRGLGRHAEVAA